ncbi:gastrula zinc finger protein XlCGF26.1 [Bombina bombina]|uniref:gastrula zinc finger protein XlCGF26.1 n=1 Tax=Bombina bombina TaxID=8345 RepID=UPI00235B19B4|nr:gastrula zinc finger protein XlCGF26.1 [Bombina bombina]XP_053566652.1 gastrula zinc finger protein XlCGF26.1 [Bombina bombina]
MQNQRSEDNITMSQNEIKFEEVSIYFSEEEWGCLREDQKLLYKDVMMETYQTILSLGWGGGKPAAISEIEQGVEPYVRCSQQIKEEEQPKNTKQDGLFIRNSLQHPFSSSTPSLMEDTFYMQSSQAPSSSRRQSKNHYSKVEDVLKDLNSHAEEHFKERPMYISRKNISKFNVITDETSKVQSIHKDIFATQSSQSQNHIRNRVIKLHNLSVETLIKDLNPNSEAHFTGRENRTIVFNKTNKAPSVCEEMSANSQNRPACSKRLDTESLDTHKPNHVMELTVDKSKRLTECGKSVLFKDQRIYTVEKPSPGAENGTFLHQNSGREQLFPCSECNTYFTSSVYLYKHQKFCLGGKPFSCSECEKQFTSRSALRKHQLVHTGVKAFQCPECEKCFTRKNRLDNHLTTHTEKRPFRCPECKKCYKTKQILDKHVKIHSGEKPFGCTECGKTFRAKSYLDNHVMIHTGERPLSCSECNMSFRWKKCLARHLRFHRGEKPYACLECGKYFSQKAKLQIHQRIHTGEKPFACPECEQCFRWPYQLDNHKQNHL